MKLIYSVYGIELELEENQVYVLTVENTRVMTELIQDLWRQCQGEEGELSLVRNGEKVSFDKNIEFVYNPVMVSCNNRKIISKLYKQIDEIAREEMYEKTLKLNSEIVSYLDELSEKVPYPLANLMEMELPGLLKLYRLEVEEEYFSLAEQLVSYLRIMHQICGIKVFVCMNLKQFFNPSEIQIIYQDIFLEKLILIDIEGKYSERLICEKNWIIDESLCIIEVG